VTVVAQPSKSRGWQALLEGVVQHVADVLFNWDPLDRAASPDDTNVQLLGWSTECPVDPPIAGVESASLASPQPPPSGKCALEQAALLIKSAKSASPEAQPGGGDVWDVVPCGGPSGELESGGEVEAPCADIVAIATMQAESYME
jgi:hypothetical protein